jgi:hypothetical protein
LGIRSRANSDEMITGVKCIAPKNNSTFCPLSDLGLSPRNFCAKGELVLRSFGAKEDVFVVNFPFRRPNVDSAISLCLRGSVVNSPTSHLLPSKTPAIPPFSPNSTNLSLQKNKFSPLFQKNVDSMRNAHPNFQKMPVSSRKFTFQHLAHPAAPASPRLPGLRASATRSQSPISNHPPPLINFCFGPWTWPHTAFSTFRWLAPNSIV